VRKAARGREKREGGLRGEGSRDGSLVADTQQAASPPPGKKEDEESDSESGASSALNMSTGTGFTSSRDSSPLRAGAAGAGAGIGGEGTMRVGMMGMKRPGVRCQRGAAHGHDPQAAL